MEVKHLKNSILHFHLREDQAALNAPMLIVHHLPEAREQQSASADLGVSIARSSSHHPPLMLLVSL